MSDEEAERQLIEALRVLAGGLLVSKFVVVAEVADTKGSSSLLIQNAESQSIWDTLGMLRFAQVIREKDAE